MVALCATLFSFAGKMGGEGFEIYLNNKLVLQQFGSQVSNVKSLQLDQRFLNDQLSVKYYHCGQAGKNRSISIKDGQNKILKEWRFADAPASDAAMICPVKDILNLRKVTTSTTFNLYYSSKELPNGRLLTSIVLAAESKSKSMTK
ncbi:MAG: hypothetical protein ACHQEB_03380 [Chitinophagales bacterium]